MAESSIEISTSSSTDQFNQISQDLQQFRQIQLVEPIRGGLEKEDAQVGCGGKGSLATASTSPTGSTSQGVAEGGDTNDSEAQQRTYSSLVNAAQFFTVKSSELTVKNCLGSGAHAEVYKAVWVRAFAASTSTITVAVKRLHSDLGQVYRDREALTILTDHPNLVKCFDSTVDPPYLIVTEFCGGGSLFDLLYNNTRQELMTNQRSKILRDVAAAMRYLHSRTPSILHRDLKSSNVLLTKRITSSEQTPFAKVADFGLSRLAAGPESWQHMTVGVGTWRWMAPEIIDMEDTEVNYDNSVDVYSFAILMYEVLARKLPYIDQFPVENNDPRLCLHVCLGLRPSLNGHRPEIPEPFCEIMQRAWAEEREKRPSFEDIDGLLSQIADLPTIAAWC